VFQSRLAGFIAGDLVQEFIQHEAICLLRDLLVATRPDTPVSVMNQHEVFY